MGIRETKEPRGINGVPNREPTVAAGVSIWVGDNMHGDEHGENMTVNMVRGATWDGIRTVTAITRGQMDITGGTRWATRGSDVDTLYLGWEVSMG